MSKHLTPAKVCERQFGGPSGVAAILGLGEKAPYNWHHPSNARDAGDLPSTRYMRVLLGHAAAAGIAFDPSWLIRGATEDEIRATEARVAAMARDDTPASLSRAAVATVARDPAGDQTFSHLAAGRAQREVRT